MGIETGEPRPPAPRVSAEPHCAGSGRTISCAGDNFRKEGQAVADATDVANQKVTQVVSEELLPVATTEEEEMSIFCERAPRDIVHFETVYNEDLENARECIQLLANENLCKEAASSKALALQKLHEEETKSIGQFNKNNIYHQWTYENSYLDNGFHTNNICENEILKTFVDPNGNIPLAADANGLLDVSAADKKKNVFVRRGDSQTWRAWQEILGQSQPEKKLHARYQSVKPIVMCFPCTLTVYLSIEGRSLQDNTRVYVDIRDDNGDLLLNGVYSTVKGYFTLNFVPNIRGEAIASMKCIGPKAADVIPYKMRIDVLGNNPILSFNDDCSWPVTLAYDQSNKFIYVAYNNYISKYREDDEFVEFIIQLTYLSRGHYNDLALTPNGQILVASYSGFHSEPVKYRYQAINIYDTDTGRLIKSVDNSFPLFIFDSPILHLAIKSNDSILVADRFSICEISVWDGEINSRLAVLDMGSVSRIAFRNNRYYVADGNIGYVKIYDELGIMETCFQFTTAAGGAVRGLSGLAVDQLGNILVSDCLSGSVHVYKEDGALVCSIDSDWEMLHWPLNLVATDDGHMLVVDHRNACVKKYKYL